MSKKYGRRSFSGEHCKAYSSIVTYSSLDRQERIAKKEEKEEIAQKKAAFLYFLRRKAGTVLIEGFCWAFYPCALPSPVSEMGVLPPVEAERNWG